MGKALVGAFGGAEAFLATAPIASQCNASYATDSLTIHLLIIGC